MALFSRRTKRLETQLAQTQAKLDAALARLPTVSELRSMEQADAILAAQGHIIAENENSQHSQRIIDASNDLGAFLLRQPDTSNQET